MIIVAYIAVLQLCLDTLCMFLLRMGVLCIFPCCDLVASINRVTFLPIAMKQVVEGGLDVEWLDKSETIDNRN